MWRPKPGRNGHGLSIDKRPTPEFESRRDGGGECKLENRLLVLPMCEACTYTGVCIRSSYTSHEWKSTYDPLEVGTTVVDW